MRPLDPRVLPHLAPARRPLAVVLVGNLATGALVVAQAFAAAALITTVLRDPAGTGWHTPALSLLLVTVARGATGWVADVAAARAAGVVGVHLRRVVLESALDLDATEVAARREGELTTLATRGVAAVEPYLTRYLPALVLATVLPVLVVVAIATQDWLSALIVVLTLPLVPVFAVLIGLTTQERADRQWRALGDLAGHFLDVVRGLPTLVVHRRARAQVAAVRSVTERYRRRSAETLRLAFASSAALELIATISIALVAVAVGLRLAAGGLDLQVALTVLLLAPEAYWPLRRVGAEFHAAAEGTATFEAIHTLAADRHHGVAQEPTLAHSEAPRPPRPLRLDEVTLTWPGRREPVLAGLSATLPARGLTAVVGRSGSGKTTLLQALLGELPVAAGLLRVGADDLAHTDLAQWQRLVAHVPQRPWLTAGTIAANLRIGRPDAVTEDLWEALGRVDLAADVQALPDGLDTVLGDDGAGLSAGQRARIALARVVVSHRPYVILDEPTAHLDEATERILLTCLRDLARSRTVIVVAHRPAVLEAADHVVDLDLLALRPTEDRPATHRDLDIPVRRAPAGGAPEAVLDPDEPARRGARWQWPFAVLLSVLASASGVALTATAGWLIARAAEQPPVMLLTLAIVGVRTFGLARPAFRYAERLVSHDVALRTLARRRAEVYAALVPLVPGRLGRRGDALTGIVDDVDALVDDRLRVRLPLLTWAGVAGLAILLALAVLPAAAPVVAAVSAVGPLAYALTWALVRRHEPAFVAARADVGRRALDVLSSTRELVLWQAASPRLAAVDSAGGTQARAAQHSASASAAGRALSTCAAGAGVVVMVGVGASAAAAGELSGPMLALLVLLPLALGDVLLPLADAGALRVRTRAAAERLAELERREPAVTDPPVAISLPPGPVTLAAREVSAAWEEAPALTGASFDLAPGSHLGVVGPSGSGKSTLAAVLLRFLTPTEGTYTLGGVDIAELTTDEVLQQVGLLHDDPHLFASTLAENVRLARPGASDPDVEWALRCAHLGDWLDALPAGLQTRLGDGGADVSGGERARIGLARAVLADRPVLVLDEPTAHLDTTTARALTTDLLAASAGRSLVWITHDGVGLDQMDAVLDLAASPRSPQVAASGAP